MTGQLPPFPVDDHHNDIIAALVDEIRRLRAASLSEPAPSS